jgi:hypothetical protein
MRRAIGRMILWFTRAVPAHDGLSAEALERAFDGAAALGGRKPDDDGEPLAPADPGPRGPRPDLPPILDIKAILRLTGADLNTPARPIPVHVVGMPNCPMSIATMPLDELQRRTGMTMAEVLAEQRRAAADVLPFIHRRWAAS